MGFEFSKINNDANWSSGNNLNMTDYLATKADREESKPSVAKGDTDGWTTVSRRSIRGRPANSTGKHKSLQ